jgi:hypothetical protein
MLSAAAMICMAQVNANTKKIAQVLKSGNGQVQCLAEGSTPCTARQVTSLKNLVTSRTQNRFVDTRSLALAAADGTMRCLSKSGAACGAAEIAEINQALGLQPASK